MSAEQTPDIETVTSIVLDSLHYADHHGGMSMLSLSRHVAQALAPVLAAAVRDAEQRAWREGAAAGHHSPLTWFALRQCNPYRADRVAEPQHDAATSGKESEASDE